MMRRVKQKNHIKADCNRQRGMTLIETMVAMAISSVLILGSIQMYSQARSNYRTTESVARLQENLRFSIDMLDDDVLLAGFWGKTNSAAKLTGQYAVTVNCKGSDVTDWVMNITTPIKALQQESDLPKDDCRGTKARENSDVLIVRHATVAQNTAAQAGVVQIQSNGSLGAFFDNGNPPADAGENGQIFDVAFNAYYVSDVSKYDPNLPSLRRLSLNGNRIEDQEIIPGVENLQVQFGIDRTGDGQIDLYVNGDEVQPDDTIISTQLWLLVRSEQKAGQGYEDKKGPYAAPGTGMKPIDPLGEDADDYPPTYRRMALTRTIFMRNVAN